RLSMSAPSARDNGKVRVVASGKKICTKCGKEKAISKFGVEGRHWADGKPYYRRYSHCRVCKNTVTREWRFKNKDKVKQQEPTRWILRNYGISREDYQQIWDAQR